MLSQEMAGRMRHVDEWTRAEGCKAYVKGIKALLSEPLVRAGSWMDWQMGVRQQDDEDG